LPDLGTARNLPAPAGSANIGCHPGEDGTFVASAVQISSTHKGSGRDALPELETSRLRLRPFAPEDHVPLHRVMSAEETFKFSERGPMAPDESWARLLRHVGHWALFRHGLFGIEHKDSGELIGEAGFADFKRGLGPKFDGFAEASWTLAPPAWGNGYAAEAAIAAHRWLCARLGVARTVCMIHRDNERSLRVASRLGYLPFEEIDYRGYKALLFERLSGVGPTKLA
jgi:RimJ/RimL family protein N-acetyltransferase